MSEEAKYKFEKYDGWETDVALVVRAMELTYEDQSLCTRRLSRALHLHKHDWRWASLPYTSDPKYYPYKSATVQCVAEGCDLGAHQYVTVEQRSDLPKYDGPDPRAALEDK